MDGNIVFVCLVISINAASSAPTIGTLSMTPVKNQQLSTKPASSYEVTENVVDIPDDRTLPPIVANFSTFRPFNIANTSIITNTVNKHIKNDTGDENNQVKRTSFTYVHFTKDPEKHEEGAIKKLIRGVKDYVYGLKRGVVDGLHSFFHSNDGVGIKNDQHNVYTEFHRSNVDVEKEEAEDEFFDTFHRSEAEVEKNEEIDIHNFHRSYDSEESSSELEHDEFKHDFEEFN